MSEGKKLPQYLAAVCICIGAWGTGTIIAWTANITDDLRDGKLGDIKMSNDNMAWVGSFMTLGAALMCFPIGLIADTIGRKPTVLLTTVPFIIGWLLITFCAHIAMVYVGRFLVGVAGGSFCVTAPMYTSEIAQTEIRGTLGTFLQLFITIGILYVSVLGAVVPMTIYNILCLAIPVIFGILFIFQPESPYYDVKKDKIEKAQKSFKKLRGDEYDFSAELKTMQAQAAQEKNMGKFWDAMKTKAAKKATLICFMLMFYQQLSGINAVMMYSKDMFIDANSSVPFSICVMLIGAVQVVATVISSWCIEKVGRKLLLMISAAVMAFSSIILGIYFLLKNYEMVSKDTITSIAFIPIVCLMLFIIAFSFGMGPIPWLASSEIFPLEVKANCSSAAGTFNWLLAFLVTRFYPPLSVAIGNDITFFIFAAITVTAVFFVMIVMPETKGKTFEEIQAELNK